MAEGSSAAEAAALRERVGLNIDLVRSELSSCAGYAAVNLPNRAQGGVALARWAQRGAWRFFIRAVPYAIDGRSNGNLAAWVEAFDPREVSTWAARFEGPFTLVSWRPEEEILYVTADRIGSHRLYVHAKCGRVTITDHLLDQVRLQRSAQFDQVGTHVLLTLGYGLDPTSPLKETSVVVNGRVATCTRSGTEVQRYYEPVEPRPRPFETIDECIRTVDGALRGVVKQMINGARPLVMVSGGIDSLVLMRYVRDATGGDFESMTCGFEGSRQTELLEGAIAAGYYGSSHSTLIIPQSDILDFATRALVQCDVAGFGGVAHVAQADWFRARCGPLNVFRGEDTRLHTPPLDWPTHLALRMHRLGLAGRPLARRAWEARKALSLWPVRRGRNYARYILAKTELAEDLASYAIRSYLRYHDPRGEVGFVPRVLADRMTSLPEDASAEEVVRWAISTAYDLQYTDDMHAVHSVIGDGDVTVHLPFYAPAAVAVMNKVSLAMGTKRRLVSPRLTRSPFPFVDKYVLRALMRNDAPAELLYRRKSTAPANDVQNAIVYPNLVAPGLRRWATCLLDNLPQPARDIASVQLEQVLGAGLSGNEEVSMASTGLRLLYLSGLAWQMNNPRADLHSELKDLRPSTLSKKS